MNEDITVAYRDRRGSPARVRCLVRGRGPAVVLIHGVGMRAEVWEPQMQALSSSYEVLAVDMLGHGGSSVPPEDADLSDYADAIVAVLDRRHIRQAHILGHSMGALVALEVALTHPGRILGVAAMNAVFCRTPEQRASIEGRLEALGQDGDEIDWTPTIKRWFGNEPAKHQAAADRLLGFLRTIDRTGYERTYQLFAHCDAAHRERLAGLTSPALFITGELDHNSSGEMSAAMAALAPHGRSVVIPGERHMMAMVSPDTVNRYLLDFLTRIDDRAAATTIDAKALRKALGSFATGVTVITTIDADGLPRGFTANSFTSVSLEPPLVLVCIAKTASSCPVFSRAGHFAVNVLSSDQADVSNLFATKAADKFARTAWRPGTSGSPVLAGAAASFECRRYSLSDAGDHVLLIGEVLGFDQAACTPLAYCRGAYVDLNLDLDLVSNRAGQTRVGALVERDGALLLEKTTSGFDIPWAETLGGVDHPASLKGRLHAAGVGVAVGFLFSVFEDRGRGGGTTSVVYRGVLQRAPAISDRFVTVPFERIPWEELSDAAVAAMLRRYIDERRADLFGVYVGDVDEGEVRPLARTA